uniref:Transcription initiation factor IIA subunit 2 n=1 Tax=Acrobeloides nanus TaxID=290746 RepID=A0A914DTH2_9BILA
MNLVQKAKMSYQMYRTTTLGVALQETLDELIRDGQLTNQLALRVLATFDKCINNALSTRTKNKTNFKADKLRAYRFCDNVWTFVMENVEIRENQSKPIEGCPIERVKVVACDANAAKKNF